MLGKRYQLIKGVCNVLKGSLTIGGFNSSAFIIITFLSAWCKFNDLKLSEHETIMTALDAENNYVGVSCGKLDQSCEVYSKKNYLLYLDTKDESYESISLAEYMKPYKIAILFSGIERSLTDSAFNMRVDECRSVAYALKAYASMKYGKFNETNLCDVPVEVYHRYKDRLLEN